MNALIRIASMCAPTLRALRTGLLVLAMAMTTSTRQRSTAAVASRATSIAIVLSLSLFWALPGRGQTCSATMSDVNLGNVDTLSASPTDMSGTVSISCTGFATPSVRVCVSLGAPNGNWDGRILNGPASSKLSYNIYKDATYVTVWGSVYDPQVRTMVVDLPVSAGAANTVAPYYGRVFGAQTGLSAGAYSSFFSTNDTVVQSAGYSGTPPICSTSSPPLGPRFSFNISATVVSNCTVSATNIDFGQFGLIAASINTTGLVTSTCTNGVAYTLSLGAGSGTGATMAQRRMTRSGGSEALAYGLYRDSARTQVWGDGSSGSTTVSNTGTGAAQTSTVYATVPAQTAPRPGSYVDTITVTVTF